MLTSERPASVPTDKRPQSFVTDIEKHCRTYSGSDLKRSLFQLATTFSLYLLTLGLIIVSLEHSFFLTALLIVLAAGLLTRIFIIQHDCGHGSYFKLRKANDWTGRILSLLTLTPYNFWRLTHNLHHATSGNLDRRSLGGIDTMTVREYKALPKNKQKAYRIYRNPVILILIGTPLYILLVQRIPTIFPLNFFSGYKTLITASMIKSILLTNASLLTFYYTVGTFLGFYTLWTILLPIIILTSWIGGWLFYVQHQFEDTYWQKNQSWNSKESALLGSSYYHLPKIFQWFTGNIGLHHIHHLCSKIPNYKLQHCMDARPELKNINHLTFLDSLKCLKLKLWDEDRQKLVCFKSI
ncbi:MAG: fatty acid desaturase [Alphaproteobacteria bacterium]|nr:fatty acid desaturase [Alphaproteobacteria bacterium]MCB1840089.1 fatty acid desaturase [Alphaproteobacteria bacterium]